MLEEENWNQLCFGGISAFFAQEEQPSDPRNLAQKGLCLEQHVRALCPATTLTDVPRGTLKVGAGGSH